ncbi:MAG TPA: hypothetical protein VLM89_04450 [Phycisphaerae bacterium]|nr:hypothetical protein [Phycisphaerae bacterium]
MSSHAPERPSPVSDGAPPDSPHVIVVSAGGRQTALWLIAVLLAVIATVLLLRWDETTLTRSAWAQTMNTGAGPGAGARGIYAFTGQLDSRAFGLFMLDVDSGTVWCYEMVRNRSSDPIYMRLVAARSWLYDRYLEEFNTAPPTPTEVRQLVEQQRLARQAGATQPGGAPTPAPATGPAAGGITLPTP